MDECYWRLSAPHVLCKASDGCGSHGGSLNGAVRNLLLFPFLEEIRTHNLVVQYVVLYVSAVWVYARLAVALV